MNSSQIPKDLMPTLVIGLGGTGFQVIKRLKQQFNKRYDNAKLPIRYLLIDTDLKTFLDDSIENDEKCQLRFGDGIKNTLDWAYNNPNFDWLPQNPKITPDFFTSTDQGAGLIRPIGRLYLYKNAKLVYDILTNAKNDMVDLHKVLTDIGSSYLENIERHKVYIVGSLAGGTGCGTFLDVAVMLSKIFNRDNTNLIGLFTMESCYDDKLSSDGDSQSRSKANCYAALKELEFYMSSIVNHDDERYLFKYSSVGEIKLEKKLLDVCYLIENKNEIGGVLTNIEDIYDLCSLQLFQEIGTTLGSQLRADYANFICKDRDPVFKKERNFSTFSSSSMVFPVESLKHYCSLRLSNSILSKLGEGSINKNLLQEEVGKLMEQINSVINFEDFIENFASKYKVQTSICYEDMNNGRIENLTRIDEYVSDLRKRWQEKKADFQGEIQVVLNKFVDNNLAYKGIEYIVELFTKLKIEAFKEYSELSIYTSYVSGKIKSEINTIKDRKIVKGKESIPLEFVNKFNGYMDQEEQKIKIQILKDRYTMIEDARNNVNEMLLEFKSRMNDMKNEIKHNLNKIQNQSMRTYGGNIIARDMIGKEYYESFYSQWFEENIDSKISYMFQDKNILDFLKEGYSALNNMCNMYVRQVCLNTNIINLMEGNAKNQEISLNDYMKKELDITSKLATPFWSAIKNPEVSWTECYYIGCIKDEVTNNVFTIKPPEAVDRWIRNQNGERSRQARYVETTEPYSIDVIHITMGACAAYLPDIKNYKQFYIKLLTSRTYPLHLNERYIGFDELELEFEKLIEVYSIAKTYGIIVEADGLFILNIKKTEFGIKHVFYSPQCLNIEFTADESLKDLPENSSIIPESLKIGDSYLSVMETISQSNYIYQFIQEFIDKIEVEFSKEVLTNHQNKFVNEINNKDFIAKEKIMSKLLAN